MNKLQLANRLALRALATRGLASSAAVPPASEKNLGVFPDNRAYKRLMELQTEMTRDDGRLVWQKRGTRDSIAYSMTLLLCAIGMGMSIYNLLRMSFPKKSQ